MMKLKMILTLFNSWKSIRVTKIKLKKQKMKQKCKLLSMLKKM